MDAIYFEKTKSGEIIFGRARWYANTALGDRGKFQIVFP